MAVSTRTILPGYTTIGLKYLNCCIRIILEICIVSIVVKWLCVSIYRQIKYHDALVHRRIVPPLMFWLLNNKFKFQELENDEKKCVFLPLHIYRRHPSLPVWKMWPISNLQLIGKNIIIFLKQNFSSGHIRKNTHQALNLIFGKYLEPRKELARFARSKPLQKCWTGVTFGHLK